MNKYELVERALREGLVLRAFLSGGGLRVVRIVSNDGIGDKGYGEHPHLEEAICHAGEDYAAGGREYHELYGLGGIHTGYLTGDPVPDSPADTWIRQGQKMKAACVRDAFCVWLAGLEFEETPKSVMAEAKATDRPVQFLNRGVLRECLYHPHLFANGDEGHVITNMPWGSLSRTPVTSFSVRKFGSGATFQEALDAACASEVVEVPERP